MGEGAATDGDMTEAAIRLRAELDATRGAIAIGSLVDEGGASAVVVGAHVVAADLAILHEDVFGGLRTTQAIGALQDDSIVAEGVDLAVAHHDTLTAVNVDAVAVGVDDDPFDEEVIHTGEQHGEVAAAQESQVTDGDLLAVTQGQGLVRLRHTVVSASRSATRKDIGTIDQTFSLEGDVVEVFAPEQGVVPMAVTEVLVMRVIGFGRVIALGFGDGSGLEHCALFDTQGDIALQMDGIAEIGSLAQHHPTPTLTGHAFNGGIDGRRVNVFAITHCANFFDVEGKGLTEDKRP